MFVFNKSQNLDNSNLNKFHIFKELMGKDGRHRKFPPKPSNWVQLIIFTQYWFNIMNHGRIEENIWQSRFCTKNKVGTILPQSITSQNT